MKLFNNKKPLFYALFILLISSKSIYSQKQNKLEIVASFPIERPGNIAVSADGRIFITMSDSSVSNYVVKEIRSNGTTQVFPDSIWTAKSKQNSIKGISRTIGIQVSKDILWVLDIGANNIIPKQLPKLVGWNINTKLLHKIFILPEAVLQPSSFLQDFVIDEKHQTAVIADMSMGNMVYPAVPAFIVLNLETGFSRRVLENDKSFQPADEDLIIDKKPLSHTYSNGTKINPHYPLNPIAIDSEMEWIYFGALGGNKIYRISTEILADENLNDNNLSQQIKYFAPKPKSDGFKIGKDGQIYVTDVENNAIGIATPAGYSILAQDKTLLSWPDGLAISPDNFLYITSNQLQNKPYWNNGKDDSKPPYYVLKLKLNK